MSDNSGIEKLIKDGFADLKHQIGGLKEEMKGVKEEITDVKKTANQNKRGLAIQATELKDVRDQMKDLISSDQDRRRRAGRR